MPMTLKHLKNKLNFLRRTPLHPQWLLSDQSQVLAVVERYARGTTLDIGCGDRWIERHLHSDCQYVALDYLPTVRLMYGTEPGIFADASHLPFLEECFDCVLLLEVLEHLPNPDAALAEIRRTLKPAGYLILSLPFLYPIHDAPFDFQRLTRHGLISRLESNGLSIHCIEPTASTLETAGLLCSIALAGTALNSVKKRHPSLLIAPLLLPLIPLINISAWIGGRIFPTWDAMTAGYKIVARRPD